MRCLVVTWCEFWTHQAGRSDVPLDAVYGPSTYKRFLQEGKEFVSFKCELKPSSDHWRDDPLEARSFDKLMEIVSFFSVMNKRSSLFFRGQGRHLEMIPCIFRSEWTSIGKIRHKIPNNSAVRQKNLGSLE